MGADFLATGHYAKISKNNEGIFFLEKGKDKFKDQSYFLFTLSQKELSRLMFPLGSLTKKEVIFDLWNQNGTGMCAHF